MTPLVQTGSKNAPEFPLAILLEGISENGQPGWAMAMSRAKGLGCLSAPVGS